MTALKKTIALVLSLLIALLSLNACGYFIPFCDDFIPSTSLVSADTTSLSSEKSPEGVSSKNSSKQNKPSSSKKQSSTSKPNNKGENYIKVEEPIVTDKVVKDPQNVGKIKELVIGSRHTALKSSSYYQYSLLSGSEKNIYTLILTAIKSGRNVVNFNGKAYSKAQVSAALQRVLADHPQFFYISKNYWHICPSDSNDVRALVLSYFDGEVSDEIDDNLKFIKTADRTLINQKIDAIKVAAENILSAIPPEETDVIKEKKIYDCVLKTILYDVVAAKNVDNEWVTHSFDLYGAVINKTAVCEGYAKMFQFLCYCVGINATQVIGTADGENHMWNTVLIENEWYQADLTWSDVDLAWSDLTRVYDYSYFNQTTENISKTHTIDSSYISVPKCNSTKNSFTNLFAIEITDLNSPPANYENIIANIIKSESNRIYIYVNRDGSVVGNLNFSRNFERYINNYMLYEESEFSKYLSAQGKTLLADVVKIADFYVLTLK